MKKPKKSGRHLQTKRGAKRNNRTAKRDQLAATISKMAADGLVEDQIALRVGLDKNQLRARFIDEIKAGKAIVDAEEAQAETITRAEYYFLRTVTKAFASHWHVDGSNLIFNGTDTVKATARPDAVTHDQLITELQKSIDMLAGIIFKEGVEPLRKQCDAQQKLIDSLHLRLAAMSAEISDYKNFTYQGVHRVGRKYNKGAFVTFDGSVWACLRKTDDSPKGSADWQLACKGADQRSAR